MVAGAGVAEVISPQETVTFNNVTPFYINEGPSFLDQQTAEFFPGLYWGSFDGTTNAPVIYPNGSSISELIAELFNGAASGSQSTSSQWYGVSTAGTTAAVGTGGAVP